MLVSGHRPFPGRNADPPKAFLFSTLVIDTWLLGDSFSYAGMWGHVDFGRSGSHSVTLVSSPVFPDVLLKSSTVEIVPNH